MQTKHKRRSFAKDGDEVSITADRDAKLPLDILLIAGIPLNEPVARYGPFVMNTQQEIYNAIDDYRNSRMGLDYHTSLKKRY